MVKRDTTPATRRTLFLAAARVALALTALAPMGAIGTDRMHEQLAPASAARATVLAASGPSREAAEWARLRRDPAHL